MRAAGKAGDIFVLFKDFIKVDANCRDCYDKVTKKMSEVFKLKNAENKKIAEDIINLFKECNVLKEDADYKSLYSELVKYLNGLLGEK